MRALPFIFLALVVVTACSPAVTPTDAGATSCDQPAPLCCPFAGAPTPFSATCEAGAWVCPGTSGPATGSPGECCLADGGTVATSCVGDVIECPAGAAPGACSTGDAGVDAGCAGAATWCCPFAGSSQPFTATCEASAWTCPGTSGAATGTPGACCLPDGTTVEKSCVGDLIECPAGATPGACAVVTDGGTDGGSDAGCEGSTWCCPLAGPPNPFAATCESSSWSCPGSSSTASGTPGSCCLPDGGTVSTTCSGAIIECPAGATPGPC